MGSISSLLHNCVTKNPCKFHASTLICTIIALICPTYIFWRPFKVKKDHGQIGSISGLNHHGMTKNSWKFHVSAPIRTIVTQVPVPLQISDVIWTLITSWRSKWVILILFKHKVYFFLFYLKFKKVWFICNDIWPIQDFLLYLWWRDLWWPRQEQTRSNQDGFYIKLAS